MIQRQWLTKITLGEDGCIRFFSSFHLTLHVLSSTPQCQSFWSTITILSGDITILVRLLLLACLATSREMFQVGVWPYQLYRIIKEVALIYSTTPLKGFKTLKLKKKTGISPCSCIILCFYIKYRVAHVANIVKAAAFSHLWLTLF